MKKFVCISLIVAVLLTSAFLLVACNDDKDNVSSTGEFLSDVASIVKKPNLETLLGRDDDKAVIQKGVEEAQKPDDDTSKDQDAIKKAVMLLYNTANDSRLNNEIQKKGTSLMVQRSLGGNAQGRVYMNGFTLQSGGKWYYQLASQAAKGDVAGFETIAKIMSPIAGNLQVAYTLDSNTYNYAYIMGTATQMDCTSNVFPYASFIIPKGSEPKAYENFDAFKKDRNCRDGQLELNNMRIYEDLLKDCQIKYDSANGVYLVTFAIDCENGDKDHLEDFQKNSREDLDIGVKSFTISNTISGWRAELEVWDNGYVRAFRSYEDWAMTVKVIGMSVPVESHPSNEFVYVWNNDEITSLLAQDKRLEVTLRNSRSDEEKIDHSIAFYANLAQNGGEFVFDFFTFTIALVSSVVGAIIIVAIVLAILFKKGKLPKLQAAIERDKERRRAITAQNKEDKAEKKEIKEERKEQRAERREERREERLEKNNEDEQ